MEDQGFKVVPSILQIIGHELIQNIGTHIYGQEQEYGENMNASSVCGQC